MNTIRRKAIFDVVRAILGRGFSQAETRRIDAAIDRAIDPAPDRLGALSEEYESGGRGPGTVSTGRHDPGGVSYGIYQLASRTGTAARFVQSEGSRWAAQLGGAAPGTAPFSDAWRKIAEREGQDFAAAQHAFIERTHYRPAVRAVRDATGLDLDCRHRAVRDVVWSVSVQHGAAARILADGVRQADAALARDDPDYDRRLVESIYAQRTRYVLRVAGRSGPNARRTLISVTRKRYPSELRGALAMFDAEPASA